MKNVAYRDAWRFLDDFRGKEFQGEWPTIPEMFHITVLRYPDNLAFHAFEPDVKLRYSEGERKIREVAYFLISRGFRPGDKIAVSGHNSAEWVIAYFGVIFAGCVIVPLDPSLKSSEMGTFLSFGGVKGAFLPSERCGTIDSMPGLAEFALEDVLSLSGPETALPHASSSDIAALLFTSGTTGVPKGVMLTHGNLVSDCFLTQANLDFRSTDIIYAILPLHHAYTMEAVVYISVSTGGTVVFGRKLAMSRIMKEIREGGVTIFMSVPMLYNKMISALMDGVRKKGRAVYFTVKLMMKLSGAIKALTGCNPGRRMFRHLLEKLSFENMRMCISGGGPLPASTFRMFNELGVDFVQGYGLTEASPITHVNPVEAFRVESVGKKLPMTEVRIADPDSDGNGLIMIKGPMVMMGYYRNPEATAEVLSSDGWLNTGDVGHQDKDGYLYLTGRARNIIVTEGGKNVFPEEVEDPFQLYSEIDQVCVLGYMADKAMKKEGIRIIIVPSESFIESRNGRKEDIEKRLSEIVDAVNRSATSSKRITKITVSYEPLPMTSTKKVKREEVKKLFADR